VPVDTVELALDESALLEFVIPAAVDDFDVEVLVVDCALVVVDPDFVPVVTDAPCPPTPPAPPSIPPPLAQAPAERARPRDTRGTDKARRARDFIVQG